jgi:hypothetical protein
VRAAPVGAGAGAPAAGANAWDERPTDAEANAAPAPWEEAPSDSEHPAPYSRKP